MTRLLLASGSPSRLRILQGAGIDPLIAVPDVDEDAIVADLLAASPEASPADIVCALAEAKAAVAAGFEELDQVHAEHQSIVDAVRDVDPDAAARHLGDHITNGFLRLAESTTGQSVSDPFDFDTD